MQQLSEHDAAFIYSDSEHANSNVTLLHIYDQSTAPGGLVRFKTILGHIERRLGRVPVFRQKIRRVPMDLDRPYWIEDENFDLEYHVRHIALPKPGDWRQFCIQASRIHARALDLNRPLWEIYVIEGLDSFLDLPAGSFAVLLKIHHAAIDMERAGELTQLLHDLAPTPVADTPAEPWFPEDAPGDLAMLYRAGWHALTLPWRLAGTATRAMSTLVPTARTFLDEFLRRPGSFPLTRFNGEVSPHRVFETRRFALDEFKAIRELVPGASVNDVVLAVCGGGLRRYLDQQGELPEDSLVAAAPIAVRPAPTLSPIDRLRGKAPETPAGASFAWVRVALRTDIEDPVARLEAIHTAMSSSESAMHAVGARELGDITQHAPAAAIAFSSKMLRTASGQLGGWMPLANCAITNIPGPKVPLYLHGARLAYFSAIMPIADGLGLVFSVTSYDGKIIVSVTSCYEQMPDPEVFAQCVRDCFQDYLALARQAARPVAHRARRSAPNRRPARPRVRKAA